MEIPKYPIEYIPADAPFTGAQVAWLNGFLAGLFAAMPGEAQSVAVPISTLTVVFGSQTGTAESLARSLARDAKQRGHAATVAGMDEIDIAQIAGSERLLVLCSTHGDGDPPDNAVEFARALFSADAPSFAGVAYSVFALGDSNYAKFCQCGRDIDQRLEALGAVRLFERVDADVDVDAPFVRWRDGVLDTLPRSPGTSDLPPSIPSGQRRIAVPLLVLANENLNGAGSQKETRHIVLRTVEIGAEISYEPGDALAILPHNAPERVDEIIAAAGFSPDVVLAGEGGNTTLQAALQERYTIGRLTAPTLRAFGEHVGAPELLALLEPERADDLEVYLHGRELIDLLEAYPGGFASPAEFVALLPRLAPRLYSIASSPRAHAGEVHVTVAAVRYTAHGRERSGVCSVFLADRIEAGARVLAYVQKNERFRVPADPARAAIMIGPGTGIAPFRAFLHERMHAGAPGMNWLFYGDRNRSTDFLYGEEMRSLHAAGLLTRLDTAFSRDQVQKIYVQDRMRERARELWSWLEDGAHLYLCGDATSMAKDVEIALHEIVAEEGGLDAEGAEAYVRALKKNHRFVRDVY